jgi:membrane protein DedA with SNARE-associated domain
LKPAIWTGRWRYERHGGKTIVLRAFCPSFAPMHLFVAGVAGMRAEIFLAVNLLGAVYGWRDWRMPVISLVIWSFTEAELHSSSLRW